MVLSTERIVLRPLNDSDADAIFALRSNQEVNRYINRPPTTKVEEAVAFIEKIKKGTSTGDSFYWAITLRESKDLIGTICIWNLTPDRSCGELGYELLPSMQGKGLMREALGKVIGYAEKELGIKTLEAFTHKDNSASIRLLKNAGFSLDHERKDSENPNNIIFTMATAKSSLSTSP